MTDEFVVGLFMPTFRDCFFPASSLSLIHGNVQKQEPLEHSKKWARLWHLCEKPVLNYLTDTSIVQQPYALRGLWRFLCHPCTNLHKGLGFLQSFGYKSTMPNCNSCQGVWGIYNETALKCNWGQEGSERQERWANADQVGDVSWAWGKPSHVLERAVACWKQDWWENHRNEGFCTERTQLPWKEAAKRLSEPWKWRQNYSQAPGCWIPGEMWALPALGDRSNMARN